jgi:hypothetical protein
MVKLGELNSRMKDFYEIWLLSRQFDFDGVSLAEAIRMTFEQRGTVLPIEIKAFDKTFISSKQIQWSAFRKRLQQDHVPASFQEYHICGGNVSRAARLGNSQSSPAPRKWTSPGPWI